MATIIIENVPEKVIKRFGQKVSFSSVRISKKKVDPTIRLQKLIEDPENISYWPFSNVDDFLEHLHSNRS